MEFPNPKNFGDTHDNSFVTAQSFLDNERGDRNESVPNKKNEVKDFISKQGGNDGKQLNGDGIETSEDSNINGNTDQQKDFEGIKQIYQDGKAIISNENSKEKEKFKKPKEALSSEKCSEEEEKFKVPKNSNENFEKGFKTNETTNRDVKNDKNVDEINIDEEGKAGDSSSSENKSKPDDSVAKEEKDEWMDILGSGQLKKKTLKPGEPDSRPQKADVCQINVTGKLENGTVFEQHKCLEINLGDNETVQGLDFALALMDKGEEALVIVAPRFGYGSLGNKSLVPPDATLYFNITLLDVNPEPLISTLDINERIVIGSRKKERGNWWYTREEHTLAIHSYRRALDYLDDTDIPGEHTDDQVKCLIEERLKTYNNLGMSQMKISAFDAALLSIDQVLNCQPKNVKALFRKSKILKEKGELSKSIAVIRQALAIEPDSKGFQQELSFLLAAQRKDNSKQRDLYKKMMGSSLQDNESDKKKKASYSAFKWVAAFSFTVAIIGALAMKYRK